MLGRDVESIPELYAGGDTFVLNRYFDSKLVNLNSVLCPSVDNVLTEYDLNDGGGGGSADNSESRLIPVPAASPVIEVGAGGMINELLGPLTSDFGKSFEPTRKF